MPNATDATVSVWPVSGWPTGAPVSGSHTRTDRSWLPVASSSRPSAVVPNATDSTKPVWPVGGSSAGAPNNTLKRRVCSPTRVRVSGSHTRTDRSRLPEASSSRPSPVMPNATDATVSMWPVSWSTGAPVSGSHTRTARGSHTRTRGSHTRTVSSLSPPVASSSRPSAVVPNATDHTELM